MADLIWDHTAALGTAPIFDDAVYLSEALRLPVNQNEDDLDAELVLQARESGIHDPYRFVPPPKTISRAISTMTLDSDQRSSRSIHSQETQSTSFTSAPSRTSRDHVYSTDHPTAKRAPPTLTRASHSVENCQKAIDGPESGIQSRQSSTLSVAPSVISSASSSKQAQPRKKRGSAIFSLFRRDSRYVAATELHSLVTNLLLVLVFQPHTKDLTASPGSQNWTAVIPCLPTTFANIYKKPCSVAQMQCPIVVEVHYRDRY